MNRLYVGQYFNAPTYQQHAHILPTCLLCNHLLPISNLSINYLLTTCLSTLPLFAYLPTNFTTYPLTCLLAYLPTHL